jgi:hypothetical protein
MGDSMKQINNRYIYLHYQKRYMKSKRARWMQVTARIPRGELLSLAAKLISEKDFGELAINTIKYKLLGRL